MTVFSGWSGGLIGLGGGGRQPRVPLWLVRVSNLLTKSSLTKSGPGNLQVLGFGKFEKMQIDNG